GARVAVHPLTPRGDGVTPYPEDRPNLAPASTYLGSAMHLPHTQGGFADRVALPTRMLVPLPMTAEHVTVPPMATLFMTSIEGMANLFRILLHPAACVPGP
ncbi:MAG: hypothetical protein J0H60_19015, partial [Rhizobiales bacterium]|nr:hypothetical protein [Hyphomicrobiales bacterium]